jgi:mannose-6-phosphate isomerase-like protein (cupin superfamily)
VREPISFETAQHYLWGGNCDGWHLLRCEELSVIEERMPPGTQEQRHAHTRARQFFYVLEGELTIEIEGEVNRIGARQGLEIAPGEAHQVRNESAADVRFLVVSSPPAQGDRVAR